MRDVREKTRGRPSGPHGGMHDVLAARPPEKVMTVAEEARSVADPLRAYAGDMAGGNRAQRRALRAATPGRRK